MNAPRKPSRKKRSKNVAAAPAPAAWKAGAPADAAPLAKAAPARPPALDERLVTQIWLVGIGGTVLVATAAGVVFGVPSAVLVLLGGAFAAVVALFWSSLRTALGETPLASADAFAIGAPRVEEERKRAVLRALKDLEFERSVGKISEDDYRALVAQYRMQAKHLLRQLDEQSAENRARAEELVRERGFDAPPPAAKETLESE